MIKRLKYLSVIVALSGLALIFSAEDKFPSEAKKASKDASAFRLIDKITKEISASTFYQGLIVSKVKMEKTSEGEVLVCNANYPYGKGITLENFLSKGEAPGPLGNIAVLYQPYFRQLKINKGKLFYQTENQSIPLKVCSGEPIKAMLFNDFILITTIHLSDCLDCDHYQLFLTINGKNYLMPLGNSFSGPFEVDKDEYLEKNLLHDIENFAADRLKLDPQIVLSNDVSDMAKDILSTVRILAEDSNPTGIMSKFLVILDIRDFEKKYGFMIWSVYNGRTIKDLYFERGMLEFTVENELSTIESSNYGPNIMPVCVFEYPFLILRGTSIKMMFTKQIKNNESSSVAINICDCKVRMPDKTADNVRESSSGK